MDDQEREQNLTSRSETTIVAWLSDGSLERFLECRMIEPVFRVR